jgi:hypothetical protein
MVNRIFRNHPKLSIVTCIGSEDDRLITASALLLGGFLIFSRGLRVPDVEAAFSVLQSRFTSLGDELAESAARSLTMHDFWSAMSQADHLGWINRRDEIRPGADALDQGEMDMEAFSHYARPCNGGIFMIAPGKLVVHPAPTDLPGHLRWQDSPDGLRRTFSTAYVAEVLADDFGVAYVAALDSPARSLHAFAMRGIEAEALTGVSPLRTLDRLISVAAAAAPAAVSLQCDTCSSHRLAGRLAAAFLATQLGFAPTAAVAWIRLTHPALLAATPEAAAAAEAHWAVGPVGLLGPPRRSESTAGPSASFSTGIASGGSSPKSRRKPRRSRSAPTRRARAASMQEETPPCDDGG